MADTKLTGLTATTTPLLTDLEYIVTDPGGTPTSKKMTLDTLQQILLPKHTLDGRLTLTTGTPVTTANVTAATTLYFTPYRGNKIGLYDGATWHVRTFAELSITLASLTASRPYDVWCYDNSGTPALELLTWSSTTARGTSLAYQDGVLVKSGAATRRYLGTICITSVTGQCEDSLTNRFVWNYYNRIRRPLFVSTTNSHTYTTSAFRAFNNDASMQVSFVIGVLEDSIPLSLICGVADTSTGGGYAGIGYDSSAAPTDGTNNLQMIAVLGQANVQRLGISYQHYPAAGSHYYIVVEYGETTTTFQRATLSAEILG